MSSRLLLYTILYLMQYQIVTLFYQKDILGACGILCDLCAKLIKFSFLEKFNRKWKKIIFEIKIEGKVLKEVEKKLGAE